MTTCAQGPIWTATTLNAGFIGESAAIFNNLYIAGGSNPSTGNAVIQYSSDGITWTTNDLGNFAGYGVRSLAVGNGLILGMLNAAQHVLSTDGMTWTAHNHFPPVSGDQGVAFVNGYFVFRSSDSWAYSTDGINWSATESAGSGGYMNGINAAYGGGMYVTCGAQGFAYTTDVAIPLTAVSYAPTAVIAYGNGAFVSFNRGLGATRDVYRSTDGITWTTHTAALPVNGAASYYSWLVFEQERFLACQEDGGALAYSTDGITWTLTTGDSMFDSASNVGQYYMGSSAAGKYLAVNPLGTNAQRGICEAPPPPITGDFWVRAKNVKFKNVKLGREQPVPVLEYGWTRDDIFDPSNLVTIFDNGNYLTYAPPAGLDGNSVMIRSKQPITGQKYCEFAVTAQATDSFFAFGITTQVPQQFYNPGASAVYSGGGGCSLSYQGIWIDGTATSTQDRYKMNTGDRIGMAIDVNTQEVWLSKNGVWLDGNPTSGDAPSFTVPFAGPLYFGNMHYTCSSPGSKTCYIYPSAAEQLYSAPSGFTPYKP